MMIRTLKSGELDTAKRVWETCFDDQSAFVEWYFHRRSKAQEFLGLFQETENGTKELAADLHMAPYQLRFRKKTFSSAYLIAVATMPEFRMKGFAKELLKASLTHLAQEGKAFTILLPFNVKFYTRLGWGIVSRRRLLRFTSTVDKEQADAFPSARAFPPASTKESTGEIRLFPQRPPKSILAHLKTIYTEWAKDFPGALLRSDQDWEGLLFDLYLEGGKTRLSLDSHGHPTGYALTYINKKEPTIREIAYTTCSAGQTLLRNILGSSASSLTWAAPLSDPLIDSLQTTTSERKIPRADQTTLRQHREIANTVEPFMLGRITDLSGFLQKLPCPLKDFTLNIEIHDPLLPGNCGVFQLTPADNGCFACIPSPKPPTVKTEIAFFTGLLAGDPYILENLAATARTSPELLWVGEEKHLSLLYRLFPKAVNYMSDYF